MLTLLPKHLTPRDREILTLLSQGYDRKEAATELRMHRGTIKQHLKMIALRSGARYSSRNLGPALAIAYLTMMNPRPEVLPPVPTEDKLRPRHVLLARLAYRGYNNPQIAKLANLTEIYIRKLNGETYDILGVWNRLDLCIYIYHHGGLDWPLKGNQAQVPQVCTSTDISLDSCAASAV